MKKFKVFIDGQSGTTGLFLPVQGSEPKMVGASLQDYRVWILPGDPVQFSSDDL